MNFEKVLQLINKDNLDSSNSYNNLNKDNFKKDLYNKNLNKFKKKEKDNIIHKLNNNKNIDNNE